MADKTVPCEVCGSDTYMLKTKLCLRCYELVTRITADPEIARKILRQVDETRKPE